MIKRNTNGISSLGLGNSKNKKAKKYQSHSFLALLGALALAFMFAVIPLLKYSKVLHTSNIVPPVTNLQFQLSNSNKETNQPRNVAKYKLWHEMPPSEQESELEKAFARAAPYGKMLGGEQDTSKFHHDCPKSGEKPILFGKGGEHMVCGPPPKKDAACKFLSFGIRDDPSWDIEMGTAWNCRGFAGDPSIVHKSKLHPAVTFHNVGLKMLRSNAEQRRDPQDEWILASLPSLKKFLDWDYLDVIKIDCEGCEVAMARDILAEDPTFLDNVGQISIETHATKTWVNSTEELYYYALSFALLEDAGFKLIWSSVFGCGKYEHDGCMPQMLGKMNMSCGNRRRNEINHVPIGWSCHDWLWAK